MAPPPPYLMEELVEEVLIRFPPDDPASLVRTTLVCKLWRRLVCGAAFRRRFREFHRGAAPLLGVVFNGDCKLRHHHDDDDAPRDTDPSLRPVRVMPMPTASFVPTATFRPPLHAADGCRNWRAIDARHGRVLLCWRYPSIWMRTLGLSVWDPVTNEQRDLPELPFDKDHGYSAAVACASTAAAGGGNDNCDHLDCHRQPFLVVVLKMQPHVIQLSVYSSEAGAWRQPANSERLNPSSSRHFFHDSPSLLVGSALYFLLHRNDEIVKCDLATWKVSTIHPPSEFSRDPFCQRESIVLMTDDDGGLGFVASTKKMNQLELWSMVTGAADAGFVPIRVIDLQKVLPSIALIKKSPQVSGFMDGGATRVLFMRTSDGLYSIEINSSHVRKVANCCDFDKIIFPYVSFCTPTSRVQI